MKYGNLNSLEPSLQACNGTALSKPMTGKVWVLMSLRQERYTINLTESIFHLFMWAMYPRFLFISRLAPPPVRQHLHRGADKSFARPGRKQATTTEDFDFPVSYL